MGFRKYVTALAAAFTLCVLTWLFALWFTGAKVRYRNDADSGLMALYLTPQAGVSIEWSEQGQSLWVWRGQDSWRVWPGE